MSSRIGELAALATAVCWCASTLFFSEAGKRMGSLVANLVRLILAVVLLSLAAWLMRGMFLPTDASAHQWLWLVLSGLVGFTLGDMCLFRAFVVLGPRLSTLVMSLVPPLTAVLGWLALGETLSGIEILGIAVTVMGVAMSVTERHASAPGPEPRQLGRGLLLALGGALGQAGGLVLSKHGMGTYSPLAATQIRAMAGLMGFALVFSVIGWWPRVWAARSSPAGLACAALGAVFGPVVGVSLALYAVQHTATGVASSIMSITPVLILPLVAVVYKEHITVRGMLGASVAIGGVLLLFL